jgi:excisionase family DNA binding protein
MSISEVQQRLRVSRKTVVRLEKRGVLPFFRIGRAVRIRPEDVENYLSSQVR